MYHFLTQERVSANSTLNRENDISGITDSLCCYITLWNSKNQRNVIEWSRWRWQYV